MKNFFLIDGNAILHRAYHALPPFKTSQGELVNAVYGFSSMLLNIINNQQPDYIAVSFDKKAPTFRHKEYAQYKATRQKAPDDLYEQIPRIKEVVQAFNIPIFEIDGYEADDVLGTLAEQAKLCKDTGENISDNEDGVKTFIVTGDMDTLQLVSSSTFVFAPQRGVLDYLIYDSAKVLGKYGLEPSQIVDFKALKGDSSDNIPGVMGIGDKTAVELLQKYKTLENIYENLSDIRESVKQKLIKGRENALLSKKLATIIKDVPIKLDIEKCKTHAFEFNKIIGLFEELEFKSLLGKLNKFNNHYTEIRNIEDSSQQSLF